MKKPKLEDFKLKSVKLMKNGGLIVNANYMFSVGNEAHTMEFKNLQCTVPVHDDLLRLLAKQKPNILRVEEINYRTMATTLEKLGVDNQKEVSQVVEGMTQEALSKIEITGLSISGKDEKRQVVITYTKITGNKKIAGRATTAIQLSGNVFGFEEELEDDIEKIISEVYQYIYTYKHGDSEDFHAQYTIHLCKESDNVRIIEDYGKFLPQILSDGTWKTITSGPCFNFRNALNEINRIMR